MSELHPALAALPWAGDILRGHYTPAPPVRVRILPGGRNSEDAGKTGTATYSRGGVWYWVRLDEDGSTTYYDDYELEVIEG